MNDFLEILLVGEEALGDLEATPEEGEDDRCEDCCPPAPPEADAAESTESRALFSIDAPCCAISFDRPTSAMADRSSFFRVFRMVIIISDCRCCRDTISSISSIMLVLLGSARIFSI